jgi:hypothetical protein
MYIWERFEAWLYRKFGYFNGRLLYLTPWYAIGIAVILLLVQLGYGTPPIENYVGDSFMNGVYCGLAGFWLSWIHTTLRYRKAAKLKHMRKFKIGEELLYDSGVGPFRQVAFCTFLSFDQKGYCNVKINTIVISSSALLSKYKLEPGKEVTAFPLELFYTN